MLRLLPLPAPRSDIPSPQPSPASGRGRIAASSLSPHRGERVGVRGVEQQRGNPLEHGVHLIQHLVIPEAGDAPSGESEPLRAPTVIRSALDVLSAVELDDEPPLDAREVREPRTDRMLTTEFVPMQLRSAQPMPETLFRVSGGPPQIPRELDAPHPGPLPAMRGEGVSSLPTRPALGRTTE